MMRSRPLSSLLRLRAPTAQQHLVVVVFRIAVLTYCLCDAVAKLFETKSKKVARLTAELATLEAERLSKLVVVFGYEFGKLGFYTSVSVSSVLLVALIIHLARSKRKWKRLALSGGTAGLSTAGATVTAPYTIMLALGAAIFFYLLSFNLGKAFESKKNKSSSRSSSDKGGSGLGIVFFGNYELDKTTFCALVTTAMVLLVALGAQIGIWCRQRREPKLEKKEDIVADTVVIVPAEERTTSLDVVIIGCGPRSVGWFHLMQFLDMPNINVCAVVEPYYLDKRKCSHPPDSFVDLVMMLDEMGVSCLYHAGQLETFERQTLCVIAGRTGDNPRFFRECIGLGASHIYLESPGASTIDQLKDMHSLATTRGVEVYMGYQRLCSSYIQNAMKLSRSIPKSHVFFCHNETYPSGDLPLVVTRFPEGMLHSMAAQELAVLVTQYGVRADAIESFKVNTNRLFSEKQTFYNTKNGKTFSDISRVAFKITTTKGKSVSVMADRCGGLISFAVVKSHTGKELQRFPSHNDKQASMVQDELIEEKEIMQQYTIESEEYLELKKRVVENILGGGQSSGLVSIQDGVHVMALADYCTKEIDDALETDD